MTDLLYETDILAWSRQQARALRARGAGGNALDYDNLAEEIEDVGRSILHACESQVANIVLHLLKLRFAQPADAVPHWRGEVYAFRKALRQKLTPSIRRRLKAQLDQQMLDAVGELRARELLSAQALALAAEQRFSWDEIVQDGWYPERWTQSS